MNLFALCIVLVGLLNSGFSETIQESPAAQEFVVNPAEKVPTRTESIVENEDTGTGFEDVKKYVDDYLWPANELQAPASEEGRTWGVKRLQFMMLPMIYKMGIMMTMLMVLTVISLKGLAIGVILLVLKLSAFFGKFYASTLQQPAIQGWSAQQPQPVHVHLHNSGSAGFHHHHPYSGWESASGPVDDEHIYYKG